MGFNELVSMADTPADVQGPQGAGAVCSARPALHLSQHCADITDREHCPADKQCGDNHNATTISMTNAREAHFPGPTGQHIKSNYKSKN